VGKAVVGVADRPDQGGDGTEICSSFCSCSAITNCLTVGGKSKSCGGLLLVEELVEKNDLAGNFVVAEGLEFVEGVDRYHIGCEAIRGSGGAAAESSQNDLLSGSGNHARVLDEGGAFGPANPVRHHDLLEANFEAQLAKFRGYILGGSTGLGRTAGARSYVLGEVGDLAVGIIVIQRGGFDGGKLLQKERREVLQISLRGLRRANPRKAWTEASGAGSELP
jgi:hypothetical protein